MKAQSLSKRAEIYRRLHRLVLQFDRRRDKSPQRLEAELDAALVDLMDTFPTTTRMRIVKLLSYYIRTSDQVDFFDTALQVGALIGDDEELRRGLADFLEFLWDRNINYFYDDEDEWE